MASSEASPRVSGAARGSALVSAWRVALTAVAGLVWVAALVLQARVVITRGRGSYDLGYDDVVYALAGKRAVAGVASDGFSTTVGDWVGTPPHAPFLEAYSFVVQWIFGAQQDALYVSLAALLGVGTILFATAFAATWFMRFAIAAALAASPLGFLTTNEYRPDVFYVLIAMSTIAYTARMVLRGSHGHPGARFLPSVCLGVALLFLKPPWILLTVGTFIGLLAAVIVFSLRGAVGDGIGDRARGFLRTLWVTVRLPALLLLVAAVVWSFWLGRSTYDYLFGARDHPYFFAASASEALHQTYDSTMAYLGGTAITGIYVALCIAVGIVVLLIAHFGFGRRQVIDLVAVCMPLLSIVFVILATAAAQHPSPFQGIFIYGVLAVVSTSVLAYCLIGGRRILPSRFRYPTTVLTGLVLMGIAGLFFLHGQPVRGVPALFASPYRAETSVARAIAAACAPRSDATAESSMGTGEVTVLVAPIEDMAWEGVEYYLPETAAAGRTFVVRSPNPMISASDELIALAESTDFVVVSPNNYEANRIPSNLLLHDLYEGLLRDPEYGEVPTGLPANSYAVFQKRTACDPRS